MELTGAMAGFFAAHAVWCVMDGETLTPILAYEGADGKRHMHRVEAQSMEVAVQAGRAWLDRNDTEASRALIVYDGYITLESGRTDALVVDVRSYVNDPAHLIVAIPYRHASKPGGFAVHRPKILLAEGPGLDVSTFTQAFYAGVASHDEAAPVWEKHLDRSV